MNNFGFNILQLRILVRILRDYKMIASQFGEYKYVHKVGSNPEHMLYWFRDSVAIFKNKTTLLINFNQLIVNEISRIDVIVRGNHYQGMFRFPMKLLFIVKSEKLLNVQVVLLTYYDKKMIAIYSRIQ